MNKKNITLEESTLNLTTIYRALWQIELYHFEGIEKYNVNIFIDAKIHTFKEMLKLIKMLTMSSIVKIDNNV